MKNKDRSTATKCPHCKAETETGTHGGCHNCRKVKHTPNGKRVIPTPEEE